MRKHAPIAFRVHKRRQRLSRGIELLLTSVSLALLMSSVTWASTSAFTFEAAPIQTVLKRASELTGMTFLFDPELVHGRITILAPEVVGPEEVLKLLESALPLHGYVLLQYESEAWVVPVAQAVHQDKHIIEVVPLDYASAGELADTLSQIAPDGVKIVPYHPTNSVIIRGDAESVHGLMSLIKGNAKDNH